MTVGGRPERGFALITVLWGLAILSLIAAVMLASARFSRIAARSATVEAEADAIADGAVARVVLNLLDHRPDHHVRVDGMPLKIEAFGVPVEVAIQDEYGKLDLNQVDESVFVSLFQNAGLSGGDAQALADKVVDWRSQGPGKHLNGATEDDYRAAGYSYLPRRAPFQRVDELKLVMGMTSDLFRQIEPVLTIYSGRPGWNLATAPLEALLAVQGLDPNQARDLFASRAAGNASASGPVVAGLINPAVSLAGWPFTITTRLALGRRSFTRETVIRLTGDPGGCFSVLDVRRFS